MKKEVRQEREHMIEKELVENLVHWSRLKNGTFTIYDWCIYYDDVNGDVNVYP